jgi:hypothetical protein
MPQLATSSTTLNSLRVLALAGAIAACGGGENGGNAADAAAAAAAAQDTAPTTLPASIQCHAAYRATPAGAFDDRALTVPRG